MANDEIADDRSMVLVFTDVAGSNLAEFVRCAHVEGFEAYTKGLMRDDRPPINEEHARILYVGREKRVCYVVPAYLFDIILENYEAYLKEETPEYFEKHLTPGESASDLIEETLIYRVSTETLEEMHVEVSTLHGRIVPEEMEEGEACEIVSRAYERDRLVFQIVEGEYKLQACKFQPFAMLFRTNEPFRRNLVAFMMSITLNGRERDICISYSPDEFFYITTISILRRFGTANPERFGADLLRFFEEPQSMEGVTINISPSLSCLAGKRALDDLVVPRGIVEHVLRKKVAEPFFIAQSGKLK